ncbi:MAG: glycosyltransferase family 39 protein [Anaerolineae bacterium]|nr:glycosyltransferase family 39 protein [Anaerolineae bacterium]
MPKNRSQFRAKAPLIHNSLFTILLLAFALNLHALSAENLWEDEIFTAIFASQSPADLIEWTKDDIHPPLYYLIAGAFTRLTVPPGAVPTPASDWLWRFPSVIAGVLTVAVTYKLARQGSGVGGQVSSVTHHAPRTTHHVSHIAALLLALAPIAIKYSQEARMHALFMFLSACSTWLLFRALARPRQWPRWLAYALATTANLYTMYFGFLILAAQTGLVLFTIYDLRFTIYAPRTTYHVPHLFGFASSLILACLLYLPWWPVLFAILQKRAAVGAIEGGVGSPLAFVPGVVRALGPLPEPVAWGFLALFIIGVILLARCAWPVAVFAALWLALPVALPIVLGDPRALQFRYAFVLPVYLSVIGYAVVRISEWVKGRMANERMAAKRELQSVAKLEQQSNLTPSPFPLSTPSPSNPPAFQPSSLPASSLLYFLWLLATLSFIATLGIYSQTKPDWRGAAAYLDEHASPNDLILIGPLWDEGRFIDYYYRGQAQLLTPAALLTNIEGRAETLRSSGGRVWAVNRFKPAESPAVKQLVFPGGVVVSEPQLAIYEPAILAEATLDLARQAVDAAYPWAAEMEARGVLNPDPRTARAAALRAWGDALVAAGRLHEAIEPYQTAVDSFPGWVSGLLALAETQETVGNLEAAAKAYRQAVIYNPKWHSPAADEAAALVAAGQWTEAVEKYHQIIEAK